MDEWREGVEHHQMAEATLRRFRTEFRVNRDAVVAVRDKHVASLEQSRVYFAADPDSRTRMKYPFSATHPAFLEYTARDLALATQARSYIDPDPVPLTRSLSLYFGDCTLIEPRLIQIYDDILAKLDAPVGPAT